MIYESTTLFLNILLSILFILSTIGLILTGLYLFFYMFLVRIITSLYSYLDKVKEVDKIN